MNSFDFSGISGISGISDLPLDSDDEETEVSELDKINNLLNDLTIITKEINFLHHRQNILMPRDNYINTVGEFNKIMENYKELMDPWRVGPGRGNFEVNREIFINDIYFQNRLTIDQVNFNTHIQNIINFFDKIKIQKEKEIENIKIQKEGEIEGKKPPLSTGDDKDIIISNGLSEKSMELLKYGNIELHSVLRDIYDELSITLKYDNYGIEPS